MEKIVFFAYILFLSVNKYTANGMKLDFATLASFAFFALTFFTAKDAKVPQCSQRKMFHLFPCKV